MLSVCLTLVPHCFVALRVTLLAMSAAPPQATRAGPPNPSCFSAHWLAALQPEPTRTCSATKARESGGTFHRQKGKPTAEPDAVLSDRASPEVTTRGGHGEGSLAPWPSLPRQTSPLDLGPTPEPEDDCQSQPRPGLWLRGGRARPGLGASCTPGLSTVSSSPLSLEKGHCTSVKLIR